MHNATWATSTATPRAHLCRSVQRPQRPRRSGENRIRPEIISYRTLLEVLFTLHDPTQLNRQGHDVGTRYRSGIYYLDEAQKAEAQALCRK